MCRACRATSSSTPRRPVDGLRVGYFPAWMKESPATDVDRAALETVKKLGMIADRGEPARLAVRLADAGAVQPKPRRRSRSSTLSGGLSTLKVQVPDAWPNLFRQARFLSAVDFVQADRFRRRVAHGDGARVLAGRPAARAVAARRDADDVELHRASVAHAARRLRQRLARRAATGRPIRRIRCRSSRRRAACRTASRCSAGCSTKAPSRARGSRWSGRSASPASARPGSSRGTTSFHFQAAHRRARGPATHHCDRDRHSRCIIAASLQAAGRRRTPCRAAGRRRFSACRR